MERKLVPMLLPDRTSYSFLPWKKRKGKNWTKGYAHLFPPYLTQLFFLDTMSKLNAHLVSQHLKEIPSPDSSILTFCNYTERTNTRYVIQEQFDNLRQLTSVTSGKAEITEVRRVSPSHSPPHTHTNSTLPRKKKSLSVQMAMIFHYQ